MALRPLLEVGVLKVAAITVDALRISLVHYEPHSCRGDAVGGTQHLEQRHSVTQHAAPLQLVGEREHAVLRLDRVVDGAVAGRPAVGVAVAAAILCHPLRAPNALAPVVASAFHRRPPAPHAGYATAAAPRLSRLDLPYSRHEPGGARGRGVPRHE